MNSVVPPLPSEQDFADRVAVVTGGTQGIGRHLAETLISLGAETFFCGREKELGLALAQEWGSRAHFVDCDLADPNATQAFIQEAASIRGSLDFLINNAAIDPIAPIEKSSIEAFDQVIAVNLRSFFLTAQSALPFLERGSGKAIVNLGTTNWMIGFPNYTIYSAAKSGILGLTRSLARELGPASIRVNMVSPGWIMTERQLADVITPEQKDQLIKETAMGQLLEEQHVTPACSSFFRPRPQASPVKT